MESLHRLDFLTVTSLYPTVSHSQDGVFIQRRLNGLVEHADVSVLRPVPWFPIYRPYTAGERSLQNGIPVYDRRMFYLPKYMKHWDSVWLRRCVEPQLRQRQATSEIDLIDAHFGFPTGVGCFRVGRRLGIPVFITLRGVEETDIQDKRIGPQLVEALSGCAGVVAVSDSLKAAAVKHGVPANQIRVIPNAVEVDHFRPGDQLAARRRLGLMEKGPIIVAVGSLIRRKRHHVLVQAFREVKERLPTATLVIVGGPAHEPTYPRFLRRMIAESGMTESVLLAGPLDPDAIQEWLHAADVFSLATVREGCCNAVLEALACGRAIVTTPAGDNERYVDPPKNGIIVPFDDPDALAQGLCAALECEWDEESISQSVRSRGWCDVARETLEFFEQRLNGTRS